MLRRRILLFVAIVLASMLVMPALNVASRLEAKRPISWTASELFGTDLRATAWINHLLYRAGISTAPTQVVVGTEGWLYLGDEYERTLSVGRKGRTHADDERAKAIGAAAREWEGWLRKRGVKLFRVLVGPNKSSIYPEYLPRWAAPAGTAPMDALVAHGTPWYVDPRPALLRSKKGAPALLYSRTDTHWTQLGAGVAFQAFAESIAPYAPDLRWPDASLLRLHAVQPRQGGDLARFLRLSGSIVDGEPRLAAYQATRTRTAPYADTRVVRPGVESRALRRTRPIHVASEGALNARRVLWVHDSFGEALEPLMAVTFAETLQLNWDEALRFPADLANLVERWKPDYVFLTVVERNALAPIFAVPQPDTSTPGPSRP